KCGNFLNGLRAGSMNFLKVARFLNAVTTRPIEGCNFKIRRVAAFLAKRQRILSHGGYIHKFMSYFSAHHSNIAFHRDKFKPHARADTKVCMVMGGVLFL